MPPMQLRDECAAWARKMIQENAVILDTETTGLDKYAQIVQMALVSTNGDVLFESLIRPTIAIPAEATAIHGITTEQVLDAPSLLDVLPQIRTILTSAPVVIYNAAFDIRVLEQSLSAVGQPRNWVWGLVVHCAMRRYTDYLERNRWVKLEGGNHSAVGDCLATLEVLRKMASNARKEAVSNGTTERVRAF